MTPANLDGILDVEDIPVCPLCGYPVEIQHQFMLAQVQGMLCLVHYECGDIEFFNA